MKLEWSRNALEVFNNIHSQHYTSAETIEYKKSLALKIHEKTFLLSTSIKADNPGFKGSYKIEQLAI